MRVHVERQLAALLAQEDTDHDRCITVRDHGPKRFGLNDGEVWIEGTYALSNLLQELALARRAGLAEVELDLDRIHQDPVTRLSAAIRERCWKGLTRRLDGPHLRQVLDDPKGDGRRRLYVSPTDPEAWRYYEALVRSADFELIRLPETVTPEYVTSLNGRPGLLALAMEKGEPLPFVVPGGRFNEMYGWDSYFIALGLLEDGQTELARSMLTHQLYQIRHYGKILNANRTYYLTRSQPPFLTSFGRAAAGPDVAPWAIQEYEKVWMGPTRLTSCGLSRYFCSGVGMPPETAMRHYGRLLQPFADAAGLSLADYRAAYERREVAPVELDDYFREDRSVRESGHDTSYRLEGRSTHLCPVDLNSFLYRYETDLAEMTGDGIWHQRARLRQERMQQHCWNEEAGQFFDYDFHLARQTGFESCTNLFPLWAGLATPEQARRMVKEALPLYTAAGGLLGGTERSRGPLSAERTARQWDYPFGWAPHQMLVWEGLRQYGYEAEAADLAYRWLRMITQNAVDHNGVIPEKYDVVGQTHAVFAEYSNQGADFSYLTEEGFGWTNASYQVGWRYLSPAQRAALRAIRASDAT